MKVGDLVKHKLNKGAWYGIITKDNNPYMPRHRLKFWVAWQAGGRAWVLPEYLEVINASR
tara:strand:+ start:163 stop:342 length:180 start_codon:yes stop_codon:yes gene_type:complete